MKKLLIELVLATLILIVLITTLTVHSIYNKITFETSAVSLLLIITSMQLARKVCREKGKNK